MDARNLKPELILVARSCRTLGRRATPAQAIAVAAGSIVAAGRWRSVLRLRRRGTRVLDLGPSVITPGLVDCHAHFFYWAMNRALVIDVLALPSLNAALQRINESGPAKLVGDWIVARGFDYNLWNAGLPSAADLDRAVRNHPALVYSRDGHSAWLNSVAMKRVGITRQTPDPKGGRYVRDIHGQPTGIVQETAVDQLPDPVREFARRTDAQAQRIVDRALAAAYRLAWAHGIVGVHTMDDGVSLAHLLRHRSEGRLGLRVVHAVQLAELEHARQLGLRSGFGDDWLRLGGVKIFADGALGSQTAYMFDPYPGRGEYCGVPVVAGDELKETVISAVNAGWAVWIHAIGDRAVHEAIDAIVAARRGKPPALPHRIEHAQCVRPPDVRKMARAGIVASVQPCHILGDIGTADRHWPRARRNAYPLRRMLQAGVVLAAGSDVPVESLDPRRSLFAATMRTDERGEPAGGWFPEQRISAEDTLRAFTRGAAVSVAAGPLAGTVAPGAPADLTVWREDPLRAAPETLLNIGILGCVVGGQVHLAPDA